MYRAREITVETNAFEDPIEPTLFFLIGHKLELNTLIYLLSACKATFSAINNLDIWNDKLGISLTPKDKTAPNHYYRLFAKTYYFLNKNTGLALDDKKIIMLLCDDAFEEIQQKQVVINESMLEISNTKMPLWQLIRQHKNQALNAYIFEQLQQQSLTFESITKWALILDQTAYFISFKDDTETIEKLISCQINNLSLLQYCGENNFLNAAHLLLELRLSSNQIVSCALHAAVQSGHLEMVEMLCQYGADVNMQSANGSFPLYIAMQYGHASVVDFLLKHGANKDVRFKNMYTPLLAGVINKHIEAVQMLLFHCTQAEAELMINAACDDTTALYSAAFSGYSELCALLLAHGAKIDSLNIKGYTPLYAAAIGGHDKVVDVLCEHSIAPNYNHTTPENETALCCASAFNRPLIVAKLCQKGADPNIACTKWTPLGATVVKNNLDIMRILLNAGAAVNYCKGDFYTALHVACKRGFIEAVELLLEHGADFRPCSETQETPLHAACQAGHVPIINRLLSAGASLLAKDAKGRTPAQYVKESTLRQRLEDLEKLEDLEEEARYPQGEIVDEQAFNTSSFSCQIQ